MRLLMVGQVVLGMLVLALTALAPAPASAAGSGAAWRSDELTWYGISQRRLNDTRADAGLPLLAADDYLWGLAHERARDMVARDYLAPASPEGVDAGSYMRQDGRSYLQWTELRAEDRSGDPESTVAWRVVNALLNDAAGRGAVVGPFDRLGVSMVEQPGRRVFVLLLAQDGVAAVMMPSQGIADLARQYVGAPYAWGGTTPAGFDCSGFVRFVVQQATGRWLGHDVGAQASAGVPVAPSDLQPGDLVFQQNTYRWGLSHVGIYIGNGLMVSAENESTGVRIASIWDGYWGPRFHSARRLT